ncbi:MAG: CBS domain-containing protein [Methanobrevibacter sp.]|uniref:CBS domain-containing protein n=1 Tax=Methanobrevibacter sp. TaxID=66852 RepID=UPI0026DFCD70|nr:CBS domain-containing protein [Methanobrevibacter sp.]MDO5849020.1 CBS domain-containing protein [Methanobrevibacter sp.]
MRAKQLMDTKFAYIHANDAVEDVAKVMEEIRRFTCPVVDEDMKLIGWVTSFDITRGLREGIDKISDVMSSADEVETINENAPARLAVIMTADNHYVAVPVLNDNNQVVGIIRSCDIVKLLSALYDIKVSSIYEAMQKQLKGVSWEDLMEASAAVSRRATGRKITPEEYENNINNSTFGEAIWATGGLENFFAGLISVGELVLARRVGRARK